MNMTANKRRVYEYIRLYKQKHGGTAPTITEICEACYLAKSYVFYILQDPEAAGWITRQVDERGRQVSRGIHLPKEVYFAE